MNIFTNPSAETDPQRYTKRTVLDTYGDTVDVEPAEGSVLLTTTDGSYLADILADDPTVAAVRLDLAGVDQLIEALQAAREEIL